MITRRQIFQVVKILVSIGIVVGLVGWLWQSDRPFLSSAFGSGWFFLGLLISIPQTLLSAWRWQKIAAVLSVPISFSFAVQQYYAATLGNLLLPGGVIGDVWRGYQHKQKHQTQGLERVALAIVLERGFGQLVLLLLAMVSLVALLMIVGINDLTLSLIAVLLVIESFLLVFVFVLPKVSAAQRIRQFFKETLKLLWRPKEFGTVFGLSMFVCLSYILCYFCAVMAIAGAFDGAVTVLLIPWILLAMSLPLTLGGWGIREFSAVGLATLAGLDYELALATAAFYGMMVTIAALPGLLVFWLGRKVEVE